MIIRPCVVTMALGLAMAAAPLAPGDATSTGAASAPATEEAAPADATLGDAMRRFGWRLVPSLAADDDTANILMSPWGLATVITVIDLGAQGGTQGSGALTEAWTGRPGATDAVLAEIGAIRHNMTADPAAGAVFHDANGIWVAEPKAVSEPVATTAGETLGVRVERVDFADPAVVARLNAWAAERTEGAIPVLLARPDPNLEAVIANGLHVAGPWLQPFDAADTRSGVFAAEGKPDLPVDYMHGVFPDLTVVTAPAFEAVSLPLAGGDMRLRLRLPRPGHALAEVMAPADEASTARPAVVALTLPRFTISANVDLTGALRAAGLGMLFDGSGDFSGLADGLTHFDRVSQRLRLRVDESGLEAAAVTVALSTRGMTPDPEIDLVFDRPFLVEVVHAPTGAVLICGIVRAPATPEDPARDETNTGAD